MTILTFMVFYIRNIHKGPQLGILCVWDGISLGTGKKQAKEKVHALLAGQVWILFFKYVFCSLFCPELY